MAETSFCKNCGGYIKPDAGVVRRDEKGWPIILCETCESIQSTRKPSSLKINEVKTS